MAGYYDPYTEEWIETEDQAAIDWYSDPTNTGVDYSTDFVDDYSWMFQGDDDFATGSIYNDDGTLNADASAVFGDADPSWYDTLGTVAKKYGSKIFDATKKLVTKTVDGKEVTDWGKIATIAGGLYSSYSANQNKAQPTGYQGKIPEYAAVRQQVENTYDPERRPGSSGQRYFTNTQYTDAGGVAAAKTAAAEEAAGLAALNAANPAMQKRATSPTEAAIEQAAQAANVQAPQDASKVIEDLPVPTYAAGGIAGLAEGGKPRYLAGQTDGMADKIKARIDGKQEARLSHGEFVIPADVVGHLGNGNSEAGAERLYAMMDRIRKARTGTKKQGKQINPDKYLAA
jgi:hypothetical protein